MKKLTVICGIFLVMGTFLNTVSAADRIPGVEAKSDSYFYTAKPYDADLGAYSFACRTYDPQINRWTSTDPSGFPDGTNNNIYINNLVTVALDRYGMDIWYSAGGGGHADVTVTDPSSPSGYTYYSYAPANGAGSGDLGNVYTPGALTSSPGYPSASDTQITTTSAQDASAIAYAQQLQSNPGTYAVLTNNCADAAQQIMNASGAVNLPTHAFETPNKLLADLRHALGLE